MITEQGIKGVFLITPNWQQDMRGGFAELWRAETVTQVTGYDWKPVQENESVSRFGVLRGLHYQQAPFAQAKLIRVLAGRILDVAVDLRPDSATYGQHIAFELSAENAAQLFIPQGFAHGFVVLSETARVNYKVDAPYAPSAECGLRFNDPRLAIDWRLAPSQLILTERDRAWPLWTECDDGC